jgi:hypothetical protein
MPNPPRTPGLRSRLVDQFPVDQHETVRSPHLVRMKARCDRDLSDDTGVKRITHVGNAGAHARVHMADVGELPIHDYLTAAGTIQPRNLPKSCRMFHTRCFPPCTENLNPYVVMMKSAKHGA